MAIISQPLNATQRIRLPKPGEDLKPWADDTLRELELWTQYGQELWQNHYTDLASLDATLAGIPAEIAALQAEVDALEADVVLIEADIVALEAAVAAAEADIDALQLDVAANTSSITVINNTLLAPRACRANRTAAQTIATGTVTTVTLDGTESFDTNAMHSTTTNPSRINSTLANVAYMITGTVIWSTSAVGERLAELRINGTTVIANQRHQAGGDDANCVSAIYRGFSYVEMRVGQTSGGNLDIVDASLMVSVIPSSS